MKNISRWAQANPILSRMLIALSHVLVVGNSILLGSMLFALSWDVPQWSIVILANLFFILYISYPQKGVKIFWIRYSYGRQKIYDFSLVVVYSAVIACGANTIFTYTYQASYSATSSISTFISYRPKPSEEITNQQKLNTKQSIRTKIKNTAKNIAKNLKNPAEKSGSDAAKILLFLLSVVVTFLLGYGIAALACNIACSGAEGLAWVVLLVGWTGIIWLEIIVIRAIGKLRSKKKTAKPVEDLR